MQQSAPPHSSDTTPSVNLFDMLHVLVKNGKMIARVTFIAAAASLALSFLLPKTYSAKTMILPAQEDKGLMSAMMGQLGGIAGLAGGSLGGATTADAYVTMLRSEAIKDPLIDRFSLMTVYGNKYRSDAYKKLDKRAMVSAGKKDGIVTIIVEDRDPKRAAALADAYVEELGKMAVRLNVTGAGKNRTFLEERLSRAKGDLVNAEENLKAFQAKNKTVQLTGQSQETIKGIADLRAQLAVQEVQLATYRRQFTESSQEVKSLSTSVASLKAQIAKLEGAGGGSGSSSIPAVGALPALGQEYVRLMREFKIQESLVELLTKQYEMAKLSEAKDIAPFQVIQKARVPEKKSKPKRSLMVATVTFAAFFAAVLVAVCRESFSRLSEAEQARWKMLVPEMGRLPGRKNRKGYSA